MTFQAKEVAIQCLCSFLPNVNFEIVEQEWRREKNQRESEERKKSTRKWREKKINENV